MCISRKGRFWCFPTLALLFCLAGESQAHDIHLTGLRMIWTPNDLTVSVTTPANRLGTRQFDAAIRRRLKLRLNGEEFRPTKGTVMWDAANDMVMWQAHYGQRVSRIEVLSRLYPEDLASRVIVTVFKNGSLVQEALMDEAHPTVVIVRAERSALSTPAVIGRFLHEGVLHIFGGIDHICFVLGLLLLGGSLKQLLKTITAFTLAHSLTLSLAATGVFAPSPRLVEPLIALSIVAVAAENLRQRGKAPKPEAGTPASSSTLTDWRPAIAFGFGLIHGFGFAGALAEVGLPRAALGWALVSFNVGVELGQATIVILVAPILAWLSRQRIVWHRYLVLAGSSAIAVAGFCWFVQRVVGV